MSSLSQLAENSAAALAFASKEFDAAIAVNQGRHDQAPSHVTTAQVSITLGAIRFDDALARLIEPEGAGGRPETRGLEAHGS